MDRILIIFIIISICVIGIIRIFISYRKFNTNYNIVIEFLEKFRKYINSQGKETETFSWLVYKGDKVQDIIGQYGICDMRPPFQNNIVKNYQIIINTLTEIKREFDEGIWTNNTTLIQYIDMIQQSLVRYGGVAEDVIVEYKSELKNPFKWLSEGIKFFVTLPFEILNQIGLISHKSSESIKSSVLFRIISAIVTLLGTISAIMGIILGWSQFKEVINELFKNAL